MDSGYDTSGEESCGDRFRLVPRPATDSVSDTSDGEASQDSFCFVRRCKKPRPDQDQVAVCAGPTVAAALSPPLPPSSPTPSSESGARRRREDPRPHYTVESIFSDFKKRHGALIRALTEDEELFIQQCDPGMEPLHLYGGTDGRWEVKPPPLQLQAPAPPEPTSGINLWRDSMERHKWLQKVAVHSDAWLLKISGFAASYIAATERDRLFDMIMGLPTIRGILLASSDTNRCMYDVEEKRSSGPEANAVVEEEREERSRGLDEANEVVEEEQERSSAPTEANEVREEEEDDATNDVNNYCANCNSRYKANSFWISCDECGRWYHGKCVNITSSEAEHMEHYECPDCYQERVGWS